MSVGGKPKPKDTLCRPSPDQADGVISADTMLYVRYTQYCTSNSMILAIKNGTVLWKEPFDNEWKRGLCIDGSVAYYTFVIITFMLMIPKLGYIYGAPLMQ